MVNILSSNLIKFTTKQKIDKICYNSDYNDWNPVRFVYFGHFRNTMCERYENENDENNMINHNRATNSYPTE